MESSISFLDFFSGGTKMGASYSNEVKKDVESTQSYSATYEYTLTCTIKGTELDVALYQWVTSTNDKKDNVYSMHTICRYGVNYNSPPACPWNACADGECTTCTTDWMA